MGAVKIPSDAAPPRAIVLQPEPVTLPPNMVFEDEAAKFLNRAPKTMRIWRSAGTGPRWFKFGNFRVCYAKTDLAAWQQARAAALRAKADKLEALSPEDAAALAELTGQK